MAQELRLSLLGDCRIELGGHLLADLPLAKARALLCYLAVTDRPQQRSAVTDLLWGEMSEADARRNLRVVLVKLRTAVGDYLIITRDQIAFDRSKPHAVDAFVFEQDARTLPGIADPISAESLARLTRLFNLYKGDFMTGLDVRNAPAFEEWLTAQRIHLRQLALRLGERLAIHHEETGNDSVAVNFCYRLIELDALQEETHRRLMRLLARSGQAAAALRHFEHYRNVLNEHLRVEPDAATLALVAHIGHGMRADGTSPAISVAPTRQRPLHNLPAPTTLFVGRNEELARIAELLADPACRMLTLVGMGGTGKTRLALQVARDLVASKDVRTPHELFRHGVYFVPLASVVTADQMISAIASAIGFALSGRQEIKAQLLSHLREKSLLLILDNFEHLVQEAPLLPEFLQAAHRVKILVTSRESLNLYEEWLFDVGGLSVPPTGTHDAQEGDGGDLLARYSALTLFAQRARRISLSFDPARDIHAVAGICRLMDGLPLGIELAAGWVRTHSCQDIMRGVERNLDFLSTPAQNVPERQRSLRAAFDYSWDLLTEDVAAKLARLAVFRGGFDASAAEAVAAATRSDLERLVDKSLVQPMHSERWSIHEMLRQYLAGKLSTAEWDAAQAAHSRFYAEFVARREQDKESAAETQAMSDLREEIANLRAAWSWLIAQLERTVRAPDEERVTEVVARVLQLAPMLAYFHIRECWYREGWRIFSDARHALRRRVEILTVDNSQERSLRQLTMAIAVIDSLLAEFAFSLSRYADVVELIEQALPVLQHEGNQAGAADALIRLGKARVRMGRYVEAEPVLREGLALYETIGDRKGSASALNWLAAWHSNQGQFDEAQRHFESCLSIFREHGYTRGIANTLNNLGSNFGRNDRFIEERPLYEEAHQLALAVGEPILIAVTLSNMAANARSLGQLEASRQYYESSLARCREMGERRWIAANLNGHGLTLLDLGDHEAAGAAFQEALTVSREIQSAPDILDALGGIGEVLAIRGQHEHAMQLLNAILNHPVTKRMTRERCRNVLAGLSGPSPSSVDMEADLDALVELASRLMV